MSGAGQPQAFLFADLAGFTALTDAHGDEQAADVAGEFNARLKDLAGEHGGELIKTIGDAVLIRVPEAAATLRLAEDIIQTVCAQHAFPDVRVGIDYGPAAERGGDYFGAAVNTAARVTALAGAGEILLTEAVRDAAGDVAGIEISPRGRHELRGISVPVVIHSAAGVARGDGGGLPIDPVCQMAVDPEHCAGELRHQGITFYFCSLECAARFAERPSRYGHGSDRPAGSAVDPSGARR